MLSESFMSVTENNVVNTELLISDHDILRKKLIVKE